MRRPPFPLLQGIERAIARLVCMLSLIVCFGCDPALTSIDPSSLVSSPTDSHDVNLQNNTEPPEDSNDPSNPPVDPNPPNPAPPNADYYVLKNRQKFIGLPAYFQGVEYDTVTFTITLPPQHGTFLGAAPNLCYIPNPGYTGYDQFTFQAVAGVYSLTRAVTIHVGDTFAPVIGIPTPSFGLYESHTMYAGATFDFDGRPAIYRDAGNGPYTHYIDFDTGSDVMNPFGTAEAPRRSIPYALPSGSVVELHGTTPVVALRYVIRGSGKPDQPIFIRGPSAAQKAVLRRPISIEGNYVICENIEFDCQDFVTGMVGPVWFWVTNSQNTPYDVFHHIVLRHSLIRDQPICDGFNPVAASIGVNSQIPELNDPTRLIEDIVFYDLEVRNFAQWNEYTGTDDYGGFMISGNTRRVWVLDSHVHHVKGDAIGVSRSNAASEQTPARNVYLGRNYLHHCKENAMDFKHGVHCVFSQNLCHTVRKSNSSQGQILTIHNDDATATWPAPDHIWVLFNVFYDAEIGLHHENQAVAPISSSRSYFIGNIVFDMRAIFGNPNLNGWAVHKGQLAQSRIIGNLFTRCERGVFLGFAALTEPGKTTQVLRNNVIVDLTERVFNDTGKHAAHIELVPDTIRPYTTIDHNLHHESVGSVRFNITDPGQQGHDYYTIEALIAGTGFGADCLVADPLWTDAATLDFRPTTASPLLGAGAVDESYQTFQSLYGLSIGYYFDGSTLPTSNRAIGPFSTTE